MLRWAVDGNTVNNNAYMHQAMGNQKAENGAYSDANKTYEKGLPDIQHKITAASQGLDAINDPRQIGSKGQARTLMLKAMGMNRYNDNEASAVLPASVYSQVKTLFNNATQWNGAGDLNDDKNPLDPAQKQAISHFFGSVINTAKDQHDLLKQQAMQRYSGSRYADPSRAQMLQQQLGGPMDSYISKLNSKIAPEALAPIQAPAPVAPAQQQGGITNLWGLLGKQQPQAQAPAPQGPPKAINPAAQPPSQPQQQQAAPQGAPAGGPHGPAVQQGGVTYHWNPQSGQYE
jgi:hypothetical protein